jgi:pesticin/yersiniabactin receptor
MEWDAPVTVVDAGAVAQRSIRSIDELDGIAPGLLFRQRGARIYDNISLRGQSSIDFYDPRVRVYIDGLPQDQASFAQTLPGDISRVEVLAGPQGTLYGRGAIGGVINIVTRKPGDGPMLVAAGSYGGLRKSASAVFGGALVDETLFADVAGSYQKDDGEYIGQVSGEELGDSTSKQGRVRLRYAPQGGRWDIIMVARKDDITSEEEQYVSTAMIEDRTAFPVVGTYDLKLESYGLTAHYDAGPVTISSLTSYQDRAFERTVFSIYSPENQDSFSQELRVASNENANTAFSYIVGAYFEDTDFSYARPDYAQVSTQNVRAYALFGEAVWRLSDRLDLTTGARIDWHKVSATAAFQTSVEQGEDKFSSFSPKVALGYQLSETARLYTLYSEGSKAGGFTKFATPATVSFSYQPEETRNYETGLKVDLPASRTQISLSAYLTKSTNFQMFVGVQPNQYQQNVGDVKVKGVDLHVQSSPMDGLSLYGSASLNDSTFTEYNNPFFPDIDLSGNRLPYVPEFTGQIGFSYIHDLPGSGTLTWGADVNHAGQMYFDENNLLSEEAHTFVSAVVGWQPIAAVAVEVYGTNLTDVLYGTYLFDGGASLGQFYQLGRGREVGVRLKLEL